MGWLDPIPTPYDGRDWASRPFVERAQMVCRCLAHDGYGAPVAIYIAYALKIGLYVGGWLLFCSFTPGLGDPRTIAQWWAEPVAFQKAIVWSLLFEVLGLGCGSGPLTGRYLPPIGGVLYFARPGTTKLARFPGVPLIGGLRRTWLDAGLYLALVAALLVALCSGSSGATAGLPAERLWPIAILVVVLAAFDRSLFLAARGEHYWVTVMCFLLATHWLPAAKAVQAALWWWAGVSKLNHHFPYVVAVMTSNSPMTRLFPRFRRAMYRDYPRDLTPSRLAVWMGHGGTALELGVPVVLLLGDGGPITTVGLVLMLALHLHITSSVPMGVPLEWNVMVVYGGLYLFGVHADVSPLAIDSVLLSALLVVCLVAVPLFGNLAPRFVSFLPSMRYYAGNWPFTIWLFRHGSHKKLDHGLVKSTPWVFDQLAPFYDEGTSQALVGKVMGFRLLHLHGRLLPQLVHRAVDDPDAYQWLDGEVVGGAVHGWNFGDGHLHSEQLLAAVQAQCNFADGELRCIFVEAQPAGRPSMRWRIVDAARGQLCEGETAISTLRQLQPWERFEAPS